MIARPRRASSLAVLLVVITGSVGGAGWTAGRQLRPAAGPDVVTADVTSGHDAHAGHAGHEAHDAPAPRPAAEAEHAGHHGHAAPETAAGATRRAHHDHDCENGVCRCDSRCPSRRSAPCGGALRSCPSGGEDAGATPGPARPFVLPAALVLAPQGGRLDLPDASFVPNGRALEPTSPPPRTSIA